MSPLRSSWKRTPKTLPFSFGYFITSSYSPSLSLPRLKTNPDYRQYDTYNTSLDNWITILRLAAQWDCPNVREFALSYIDKMPMEIVARIKIYKDYNAPYSYLLPLYMKLAIRERVLEREEFRVLDGDTLYSIVRAREMLRAPVPAGVYNSMISPLRAELSDDEKFDIVVAAFDIPPEEVEALRVSGEKIQLHFGILICSNVSVYCSCTLYCQ